MTDLSASHKLQPYKAGGNDVIEHAGDGLHACGKYRRSM
jgi:hypothetical protein